MGLREPVTWNLSGPRILYFKTPEGLYDESGLRPGWWLTGLAQHSFKPYGGTPEGPQAGARDSITELGWWELDP